MKILFVCTGNTCRSPMAEALLKHKFPNADVASAGIFAGSNERPNRHAIEVLKQRGIAMNTSSQPVDVQLLQWADLVLSMTTKHKQSLIMEFPQFQEKYFTLKEYVSDADKKVWEELIKAYAEYQEKRAIFTQKNEGKLPKSEFGKELSRHLKPDEQRIKELEANLTNYDISDPFGGSLRVYEETAKELEHAIDSLVKKWDTQ